MRKDEQVRAWAKQQHGLFSRLQALAAGVSESAIGRRLADGRWRRFMPGVYRLDGTPDSELQPVCGACLSLGPTAAASHSTAAFLWGLDGKKLRTPVEVTAARRAQTALPGIVVHRSRQLASSDVARCANLPTTNLARTLVDLASVVDAAALERAFDAAWRINRDLPRALLEYLGTLKLRGRAGIHVLAGLATTRQVRPTDSAHEADVLRKIREAGLPDPTLQYEIFDLRGFIARVDFAWIPQRVVLFADGWGFHHSRESFDRDHEQRERLAAARWTSVEVSPRLLDTGSWLAALTQHLRASREPRTGMR